MRAKLYFTLLFLTLGLGLQARYINSDEALAKADKFMSAAKLKRTGEGKMKLAHAEDNAYYVFSRGKDSGFVIVSGSDNTDAIIGYTDSGNFRTDSLPENIKAWMKAYVLQIREAESGNYYTVKANKRNYGGIAPLLGNMKWDQLYPYNKFCPITRDNIETSAGCVATSLAMIMNYYRWPDRGVGYNSYTTEPHRFNMSENFGATRYRWDLMDAFYNSQSSQDSEDAVAELMIQVGVALNMDYDETSHAFSFDAQDALTRFFKYDRGINFIERDYFTRYDWNDILMYEIESGRPVFYRASADINHTFVLDGYDRNGFFHVNWGWSGAYNGYYQLSLLNPAGSSDEGPAYGFNYDQAAIIGIQPQSRYSQESPYSVFCADDFFSNLSGVSQGGFLDFNLREFRSNYYAYYNGELNLGFYDENWNLVAVGLNSMILNLEPHYGWPSLNGRTQLPWIRDGYYRVMPVERPNGSRYWRTVNVGNMGNAVFADVRGNYITLENLPIGIDLWATNVVVGESYVGLPTQVKFNLSNYNDEYNGPVHVAVCRNNNFNYLDYQGYDLNCSIIYGETQKLTTMEDFNLHPGRYSLYIMDKDNYLISDPVEFYVKPAPAQPRLELKGVIIENANKVGRDDFNATIDIKNNGGHFVESIFGLIFKDAENLDYYEDYGLINNVIIHEGEQVRLSMSINTSIASGKYYFVPAYIDMYDGSMQLLTDRGYPFNLADEAGVDNVVQDDTELVISPNPVENILHLKTSGKIEKVCIYSMPGSLVKETTETDIDVSDFAVGNYIVRVITDDGTAVKRFIKR